MLNAVSRGLMRVRWFRGLGGPTLFGRLDITNI